MTDVYLFNLASQRTGYLSARQTLVAAERRQRQYARLQVGRPQAVLRHVAGGRRSRWRSPTPPHLTPTAQELDPAQKAARTDAANATVSGNSVNVESEMVKLGEVSRDYAEATGIKKIFHQMFMQALK